MVSGNRSVKSGDRHDGRTDSELGFPVSLYHYTLKRICHDLILPPMVIPYNPRLSVSVRTAVYIKPGHVLSNESQIVYPHSMFPPLTCTPHRGRRGLKVIGTESAWFRGIGSVGLKEWRGTRWRHLVMFAWLNRSLELKNRCSSGRTDLCRGHIFYLRPNL